MAYRIEVAEKAVLFRDDQVLLLFHERDGFRGYDLPGGRLEAEEHAGEALVREIREETGFVMERSVFTLYHTAIFCADTPKYGVFFCANAPEGEVSLTDHASYVWARRDETEHLKFLFDEVKDATLKAFDARDAIEQASSRTRRDRPQAISQDCSR